MRIAQRLGRERCDDLAEADVGVGEGLGVAVGAQEDRADDRGLPPDGHDHDRADVAGVEGALDAAQRGVRGGVRDEHRLARIERALQLGVAIEVDDEVPDGRIFVAGDEADFVLVAGQEDRAAVEAERVAELARDRLQDVDEMERGGDFLQDVDDRDEMVALALQLGYAGAQPGYSSSLPSDSSVGDRATGDGGVYVASGFVWSIFRLRVLVELVAVEPHDAIATGFLGDVHRLVGRAHQPIAVPDARMRPRRNAEARGTANRGLASNVNVCASTCLRTLSANVTAASSTVAGEEEHELFPAVPADAVDLSNLVLENLGELLEDRVAGLVAVGVVHALEPIEIAHDACERLVQPARVLEHLPEAVLEVPAIVEPRQRVGLATCVADARWRRAARARGLPARPGAA